MVDELMEVKILLCLNNGRGTRVNVRTGIESVLVLTLVSDSLAGMFLGRDKGNYYRK